MNTIIKKDNLIEVATGEVKSSRAPASLQCLALGSCVGVILYDRDNKVGGIAHVLLPERIDNNEKEKDALKYANNAIMELMKELSQLGSCKHMLIARLVGGALVIKDSPDIGKENIKAVRSILQKLSIPIVDEYLGGNEGRSVLFDLETGNLRVNGKLMDFDETKLLPQNIQVKEESSSYVAELEKNIALQKEELNRRVEELDNVRRATFNLLEDLEKERERLSESKAKDEAILASIGDGLIVADKEGKIIYINKASESLLGKRREDLVGKSFFESIPLEDEKGELIPEEKRPVSITLSTGATTVSTVASPSYYFVRNDKTKFPVAITATPIMLDGKIAGAIEIFRDITEEREIDKAKNEFVSLASHQLRTPLTAISWYTEMILRGDVGEVVPGQKSYLQEIYQGNQRMIELVNTLLDVSRIDLGTLVLEPKEIKVTELADSVLKEQTPKIEEKKLVVTKKFSEDIPTFFFDPKFLRMVLQNLLSNSVEYTPPEGKIEFLISLDEKDKNNLFIKVSDTGYGIPHSQRDKIFTKLFRADNARDKDTTGTGLGLYLIKSIVENAGGKIWFESEENHGTSFYVTLPLENNKKK